MKVNFEIIINGDLKFSFHKINPKLLSQEQELYFLNNFLTLLNYHHCQKRKNMSTQNQGTKNGKWFKS